MTMMKTRFILLAITCACMFVSSCKDDGMVPRPEDSDFDITVEVKPVTYAGTGTECPECEILWNSDDILGIWNTTLWFRDINKDFLYQEGNRFSGTISLSPDADDYLLYGFYPYEKNRGYDPSYVSARIPSSQIQQGNICNLKQNGFLVSEPVEADIRTGSVTMALHTPCAVLGLVLDASDTEIVGKGLSSATIVSDVPLVGNLAYDITSDEAAVAPNGKSVTVTMADTPVIDGTCNIWYVLYPADLSEGTLSVQLICSDKTVVDITYDVGELCLESSKAAELKLDLAELIASSNAEISEYRVDLGAEGTSNCYIVTGAEKYKFLPVKGNSSEALDNMVHADWLWMSEENIITDVKLDKGMITFNASGKKGNAVIAAFDDNDEIIWSWHIWLTDDPTANLHMGMVSSYQLMDRNLGAVSTEPDDYLSYGLYYQWGRKDPFIGPNHHGTKTKREEQPAFTTATATYFVNPEYADMEFTLVYNTDLVSGEEVDWTISHPMHFVCFKEESNGSGQSWFNSPFADLKTLWGYNESTQSSSKTIYDPCPPGYKVPHFNGDIYVGATADNFPVTSDAGLSGVMFTGVGGSSYYPAAGFRDHTGGYMSWMGSTCVYWSAMTYQDKQIRGLKIEPTGNTYVNPNVKLNAAYGQTVRCVKE